MLDDDSVGGFGDVAVEVCDHVEYIWVEAVGDGVLDAEGYGVIGGESEDFIDADSENDWELSDGDGFKFLLDAFD